ncbi:FdtA/QdtA family cupin domain-containing protein [Vibrio fluvialis]|nr:FdtA/QdtA family cupin domain-containing protein [Vibrio fluvialis]
MKKLIEWIYFPVIGDERGNLIALEGMKNIPFEMKRVYYLFGMQPNIPRGFHAHKAIVQCAVCVKGSCDVLIDNGAEKQIVTLDSPVKGLLIDVMQWHEMSNFSQDCVLMVLASEHYDESDYIRSYDVFINIVKGELLE